MDDLIVLLLTAAVMIGGAISSANKKKKEKEAAERRVQQQQHQQQADETAGEQTAGRNVAGRSLADILEELTGQEASPYYEPENVGPADDYYENEKEALYEDTETAEERLRRITYVQPEKSALAYARENTSAMPEPEINSTDALEEVLGGEFDLRRAVIESEILKPKYDQF